jgi:predicted deacylase
VMRSIGMLPAGKKPQNKNPVIARSTRWVRAPSSGIVTAHVKLGSNVNVDQRLALISDPLGEFEEEVAAPFDGIIIGRSNIPLAHEGDALFNVADFSGAAGADNVVEEFAAMHNPALRRFVEDDLKGT